MGEEDTRRQALNVYRMRLLGAKRPSLSPPGTGTLKGRLFPHDHERMDQPDHPTPITVLGSCYGPPSLPDYRP